MCSLAVAQLCSFAVGHCFLPSPTHIYWDPTHSAGQMFFLMKIIALKSCWLSFFYSLVGWSTFCGFWVNIGCCQWMVRCAMAPFTAKQWHPPRIVVSPSPAAVDNFRLFAVTANNKLWFLCTQAPCFCSGSCICLSSCFCPGLDYSFNLYFIF